MQARKQESVFEAARRELAAQVMSSNSTDQLSQAIKLRAAIGKYLNLEEALDAQDASAGQVRAALSRVLTAVDGQDRYPMASPHSGLTTQLWAALQVAGRLRRAELESAPPPLPPRLTGPYTVPKAWERFQVQLADMEHKSWPPLVRAWRDGLPATIEAYLREEDRFARHAPDAGSVAALQACAADLMQHIDPPDAANTPDVRGDVKNRWRIQSERRLFTEPLGLCRLALALRQVELHELALLLG